MRKLLMMVCCLAVLTGQAQFGANPPSVRWQQINTDTVRVIFPKGLEAKAQRVASIVHELQRNFSHSIGDQIRKIDIVLQNQTIISNAYVQLAPYRSEFYLTPPQNPFQIGAVGWTGNLAVHEFRHVQQYSNFNKGFSKVASVLLGEQGQGLANAAAIPDWFFEGDAVFNETKLTQQGRGSLPLFLSSYRSVFNAGRNYNYEQMRNGSLRKYVPGHYELGYMLVAYGREKYGDDIWRKVTDDAARFKPFFYPFQGAVKKYTGVPYPQFVNEAMQFYRQQWQPVPAEDPVWLTKAEKNSVVDYLYPQVLPDGSVVALKTSYKHIPAFVRILPDNTEKKIITRDIAADDQFSYNHGSIVYASYQPDARWAYREYTNIELVDLATGSSSTVARHTKYFYPDISHDGQQLVAVEVTEQANSRLVRFGLDGAVQDSIVRPGLFFSNPKFAADNRHLYAAIRNEAGDMALMKYGSGDETLVPFANRPIGFINVQGDTVLYTQTHDGRDEIWALIDGREKKGPFRLASYSTGLYQGALRSNGNLVVSAFTADGFRLGELRAKWERAGSESPLTDLFVPGAFRSADHHVLDKLPVGKYPVSRYPKYAHFFNFHSYEPNIEDPEYSLTFFTENILRTVRGELAYTYNRNEQSHKLGVNAQYGGSYVQLLVGMDKTWDRTALLNKDTVLNWNESVGYAGLQLPLNLSGGRQFRFLTLSELFNVDNVHWTGLAGKLFRDQRINYLTSRLVYTGQSQKALQQIYPHSAQTLVLQYRNVVNGYQAHQFLGAASLYLPGFSNNHNIVFSAAYHARDTLGQYLFSNNFPFARGYNAVDFPRMWRFGANYHLPLAYPDWGFGNIVYFLRLRANLFYDYSRGKSLRTGIETPFNTVGSELFFDTKWWNQQPVTFGLRYSRLLNNEFRGATNPNVWEFILPVDLFN